MPSLAALQKRTKTIKADLGDGDSLTVTYRPGAFTPAFEDGMRAAVEAKDPSALAKMVVALIIEWDLFEDDKQTRKVPLTIERIQTIPMLVLTPMLEMVGEDMRPNSPSAVPSGAGSMEP